VFLKNRFSEIMGQNWVKSIFKGLRKQRKHPVFVAKIAKMGL